MYNKSEFLYMLSNDLKHESIDTDNNYLKEIFREAEEYYLLPNNPNGVTAKRKLILGNYAFYLLDSPNLDFDKDIISKINLLNSFLSLCITNSKYCNNKIFLTFARYILKIPELPNAKLFVTNTSNFCNKPELGEKLEVMFTNIDKIEICKDYICNNIIDLIVLSIFEIFSQGYSIKRCKNCHKYFFNKNSNKYCPYRSHQDSSKSCYDYCNDISYVKKRKDDPIRSKYNRISNMLRSRYNYHQRETDRQILSDFGDDYRIKMKSLDNGEISKEDVLEFLNLSEENFRNQYVRKEKNKNGSTRNNKK